MNQYWSRFKNILLLWLQVSVVLFYLIWAIIYAKEITIFVPTFHLDGAFQTASGLFRLDAGQFFGKDFFPYLGIGPLLLLYPIFKISGSNLCASVFAAQFITLLCGGFALSLINHFIFRPKSFLNSLVTALVFFLIFIVVSHHYSFFLRDLFTFISSPGNSLRPIRSFIAYLAAAIYYFVTFKVERPQARYFWSGVLTSFVLLWSNDFAIPAAAFLFILVMFNALIKNEFKLLNVVVYILTTFAFWMILLCLLTVGHPLAILKYNFLDVAKDQWWFFAPYQESMRIFEFHQINRLFSGNTYPLIIWGCTIIIAMYTKCVEHVLLVWIGSVLFVGGAVASIGGHLNPAYFDSFRFWSVATLIGGLTKLIFQLLRNAHFNLFTSLNFKITIALIGFLVVLALVISSWHKYKSSLNKIKYDSNYFYVPELGGYLTLQWRNYIELIRHTDKQQVIEEYWGLWSAMWKTFPPWPVDSIIHALGNTREIALINLPKAKIIVSTRYQAAPIWQPWNLSQNFWFYDELLKNWTPYALSPTTIVWKKNEKSEFRFQEGFKCYFAENKNSLYFNAPNVGFYSLDLNYSFSEKGKHLILLKNNLSFGADANGYVSINPNAKNNIFPVYIFQQGPVSLDIKIFGNKEYDLKIKSCTVSQMMFTNEEVLHLPNQIN